MGMFVDVDHVTTAIDETGKNWGIAKTDALKDAVQKLPVFVPGHRTEANAARQLAFDRVRHDAEQLDESLDELARWMKDAEPDDIVELQRMAKVVSKKVNDIVGLRADHLRKQYNSIMASKN